MNVKEAADAARNYITSENPGLVNVPLDLEEAVPDPARREWRVTLSFTRPGGQQGQQSASTSRSYKEIIINDTDGAVISMPNRTPCAPKSVCKIPTQDACTAGQSKQPGSAEPPPFSLKDSLRVLLMISFAYPITASGAASLIVLFVKVRSEDFPEGLGDIFILLAALAGMFIGYFAEGRRLLRGGSRRSGNRNEKWWWPF